VLGPRSARLRAQVALILNRVLPMMPG